MRVVLAGILNLSKLRCSHMICFFFKFLQLFLHVRAVQVKKIRKMETVLLLIKMAKKFKILIIEIVMNDYLQNNLQPLKQLDWHAMSPYQSICGTYNPSINSCSSNNLFFFLYVKINKLT